LVARGDVATGWAWTGRGSSELAEVPCYGRGGHRWLTEIAGHGLEARVTGRGDRDASVAWARCVGHLP
jgi:hypothetical protein